MRQIVCPDCQAVNRAPETRDTALAKCGRCHKPLFRAEPVEVGAEALDVHLRSTKGAAVLLDVWAPWCASCRSMAPNFAKAAEQLEPRVRLLKLNSDAAPEASARLGVQSIPALFLFRDGALVARQAGAMSAEQIVTWTTRNLAAGS